MNQARTHAETLRSLADGEDDALAQILDPIADFLDSTTVEIESARDVPFIKIDGNQVESMCGAGTDANVADIEVSLLDDKVVRFFIGVRINNNGHPVGSIAVNNNRKTATKSVRGIPRKLRKSDVPKRLGIPTVDLSGSQAESADLNGLPIAGNETLWPPQEK